MTKPAKQYRCGELSYTLPQLYLLFFWLLVGAVCIGLANTLPGSILPIQIKHMQIGDTATWLILSCIGTVMNMTVCPYISVASDLFRSKWGRRLPFIAASAPPIVIALFLFAFTHHFGARLSAWAQPFWAATPATMTAIVMGLVMLLFQFFMMWINSVIWYIFIDIVPSEFFGRVMACMRLGLQLAGSVFSYFLFPRAEEHAGAIFIGVGIFYAIGVTLLCVFVKEGTYPPLTEEQLARKNAKGLDRLKTKVKGFREFLSYTFCHRVYVYRYLIGVSLAISGAAGTFGYFLNSKQLGLTDTHIGHMNGISGGICAAGILLAAIAATLVNRWHPARIVSYNYVFSYLVSVPILARWLFGTMPPDAYVNMVICNSAIYLLLSGLLAISEQPMEMLLFPKSRYGTFCAMQAMLRSWSSLIFGFIAARCFDFISSHFADCTLAHLYGDGWHYRLISPWATPWYFVVAFVGYKVYRHWAKLGGYQGYAAPAPWLPDGKDPVDRMPCRPVNPAYMKKMLYLFDACFLFFTILTPLYAFWTSHCRDAAPMVDALVPATNTFLNRIHDILFTGGDPSLFMDYLLWPTIAAVAADIIWLFVRFRVVKTANAYPDGTGLFQPMLLFLFFGLEMLNLLNYLWGIIQTPGKFGAVMMLLSSLTLLMSAIAIGVIHFMERGVTIPQPKEAPLPQ